MSCLLSVVVPVYNEEQSLPRFLATIRPVAAPEPLRLLASTFVRDIRGPAELASLLDASARLSAHVPMFDVVMGTAEDAAALAVRLSGHIAAQVPA